MESRSRLEPREDGYFIPPAEAFLDFDPILPQWPVTELDDLARLKESMMHSSETLVTYTDLKRLRSVLDQVPPPGDSRDGREENLAALWQRVSGARVVGQREIPRNVVTMNSRVALTDLDSGARLDATLLYPHDAKLSPRGVSVIASLGTAIFGKRVGQIIRWPRGGAKDRRLRIQQVVYQPEAAGDFHL
jgi:regulator of nucleoside diphosphate kinase